MVTTVWGSGNVLAVRYSSGSCLISMAAYEGSPLVFQILGENKSGKSVFDSGIQRVDRSAVEEAEVIAQASIEA